MIVRTLKVSLSATIHLYIKFEVSTVALFVPELGGVPYLKSWSRDPDYAPFLNPLMLRFVEVAFCALTARFYASKMLCG